MPPPSSSIPNPRLLLACTRLHPPARPPLLLLPSTSPLPRVRRTGILSLRSSLLSGRIKAFDIACDYLALIRRTEPVLRSFLHVAEEGAVREAEELDRMVAQGEEVGPLAGMVVGVKDNICTADMPSTVGTVRPTTRRRCGGFGRAGPLLWGRRILMSLGWGAPPRLLDFRYQRGCQSSHIFADFLSE